MAKVGDIVWAKVKGYPEWPGVIVSPATAPKSVLDAQPKNKGLVAPPENILIHFYGSRDFAWVASTNLFDFKENYEKLYKPNQKTKYYQTAVQLALDPELRAADQKRFEENEELYKNSLAAKNAEKEEKRKAKKQEKELEKRKREEEDYNQEIQTLKNSKKRANSTASAKKKEKTSVSKIINNQSSLPDDKKSSLENLLRLRVKFQKFINSQSKSDQDFVKVDGYMKEAEEFPVDYQLFKESKIGKVLKFVSKLELPQDSFDIVNRAHILMNKWRSILHDQVNEHSKDQVSNFVASIIKDSLNDLSGSMVKNEALDSIDVSGTGDSNDGSGAIIENDERGALHSNGISGSVESNDVGGALGSNDINCALDSNSMSETVDAIETSAAVDSAETELN